MNHDKVKKALVAGAGTMGHSIALVLARAGIDVNLVDVSDRALERALRLVRSGLATLAAHGRVEPGEVEGIVSRIHPDTDLAAAARGVDFALEAVVEVPAVKKDVFEVLDRECPAGAVLASNTSSLDIFNIVTVGRPERMMVAHWFAPPHIIPLVEVVPGPGTSAETVEETAALMKRLGKRPVVMKSFIQAFIVNRIQNAINYTIIDLMERGLAAPEDIDLAIKSSLGIRLPMVGVVQSLDFTGLDLINDIITSMGIPAPAVIREKVEKGHLGASASRGFYDYGGMTEEQILAERDGRYLKMLDYLESVNAFEPI